MRGWGIFAVLFLAGCIPGGGKDSAPPKLGTPGPAGPDKATLQCHSDLEREKVDFRALPDRYFGEGCTALGSVQLLEIGTPVNNLGAMTCPLARQFARWAREAVQPAARAWLDSRVVRIESFGTYSCRPLNGQAGARLSEHGRANAVDIGAFLLADGRKISVLQGWNGEDEDVRKFLRAVHQAGCRRFRVVLGPDANAFHRDHLHFDLGNGPYCR
ncbi:MAG TPA: extensin family protein [Allosphingosinicella sp.]